MESINKVEISGTVKSIFKTFPLKVLMSKGNTPYIKFAVEQLNKKGKMNRIQCMAFGHLAEIAYQNEHKDVLVLGTIEFSSYKDKNDQWHNSVSVMVQQITPKDFGYNSAYTSISDIETFDVLEKTPEPAKETPTPRTINEPTPEVVPETPDEIKTREDTLE